MRRTAAQMYAAERSRRAQRRSNAAACAGELPARRKLSARMLLVCVRTAASSTVAAAAPAATAAAAEAATSAHCGKNCRKEEEGKRSARDEWRELVLCGRLAMCECVRCRVREAVACAVLAVRRGARQRGAAQPTARQTSYYTATNIGAVFGVEQGDTCKQIVESDRTQIILSNSTAFMPVSQILRVQKRAKLALVID
jgi:hypothetical protein